jgi:catechol 2,3-dioxygenase-like lactoylglutathione lyase family enzyme
MQPNKLFPLVVTDKLAAVRAFYIDKLDCKVVMEGEGYLQVRFGGDNDGPELSFMAPDAAPMFGKLAPFAGEGLMVSVPTDDVDAHHEKLRGKGVTTLAPPSDKPWGWRSYVVADPNGVKLDFFHTLAKPAAHAAG